MLDSAKLVQQFTVLNVPRYPTVTGALHGATAASLAGFLAASAWAVLLLISFAGWGKLSARTLQLNDLPGSVACALGISLICFFGGVLNLLHAIVAPVILAVIAAGVLLYAWTTATGSRGFAWRGVWRGSRLPVRLLLLAALLIAVSRAAGGIRLNTFDFYDDGPGYMAMPPAMLAHHFFFTGPFSDRHIISSIGGGYWLQCFVLVATSLTHIAMADRTLGFLLLFFTVLDLGIGFGLRPMHIAWIELLASVVPEQWVNLTFVILPLALLLSLLWLVYRSLQESVRVWRWALLAGVIGGAAVTLKSTFLPCVGTFCLFPYLFAQPAKKKMVWHLSFVAGAGALFVMAAWMIGMKLAAGTYLYPLLGHGLDYSSYGLFHSFAIPRTTRTIVKLFLQAISLGILAIFAWLIAGRRVLFPVSVLAAAAVGITAFNLATGGDWVWRYGFPQYFAAVLVFSMLLIVAAENLPEPRRRRAGLALAMLTMVGCLVYYDASGKRPEPFREFRIEGPIYWGDLRASLTGRKLASESIKAEYRAVEDSLTPGSVTLENLAYPFLLNQKALLHQKAATIYLMDWPGAAGPAPGWPFTTSTDPLVRYLQTNSVRYVLYDYRYAGWVDINSCSTLYHPQSYSTELYVLFWMSILVHNQFDDLRRRYRSVYDDGTIAAIDLTQPVPNRLASDAVWTPDTGKEKICSRVLEQYLAGPLPKDPE